MCVCVSVLSFMLSFASAWSFVRLHPFATIICTQTSTWKWDARMPPKGSFQHSAVCEILNIKQQQNKTKGKTGSSGYRVLDEQDKSDERSERSEHLDATRSVRSVLKKTTIFAYLHVQTN